jgi:class I fructose-bisphosphate aldolase
MISLNKITKRGRALYLAYDQGMEHGPIDFNDKNVDPKLHHQNRTKRKIQRSHLPKSIAEKYQKEIKKIKNSVNNKLNGKTSLRKSEPISTQLCSVEEAIKLGAKAVGYTIYIGSEHEATMLKEFEKIQINAHAHGLLLLLGFILGEKEQKVIRKELLAYACRVGLEIGADI